MTKTRQKFYEEHRPFFLSDCSDVNLDVSGENMSSKHVIHVKHPEHTYAKWLAMLQCYIALYNISLENV